MTFSASVYASKAGGNAAYTDEDKANLKALADEIDAKVKAFREANPSLAVSGDASGPGISLTF